MHFHNVMTCFTYFICASTIQLHAFLETKLQTFIMFTQTTTLSTDFVFNNIILILYVNQHFLAVLL